MEARKAATDCSGLPSRCFSDFLYLPKADKCCFRVPRSRVCLLHFEGNRTGGGGGGSGDGGGGLGAGRILANL